MESRRTVFARASSVPSPGPVSTADASRVLDEAQPGDWFRMVLHNQWTLARLTWRSNNGHYFMFASQLAGRSHSLSRSALERLVQRGRFKRVEPQVRP